MAMDINLKELHKNEQIMWLAISVFDNSYGKFIVKTKKKLYVFEYEEFDKELFLKTNEREYNLSLSDSDNCVEAYVDSRDNSTSWYDDYFAGILNKDGKFYFFEKKCETFEWCPESVDGLERYIKNLAKNITNGEILDFKVNDKFEY